MADDPTYEQLRARLSRIEGQIRGIARMLESDRLCTEVVTQLMAIRSGIDNVGALVLDSHLRDCVSQGDTAEHVEALRSSMQLWWRFAPGATGFGPDATTSTAAQPSPAPDLTVGTAER